jgi:hypothetical protein
MKTFETQSAPEAKKPKFRQRVKRALGVTAVQEKRAERASARASIEQKYAEKSSHVLRAVEAKVVEHLADAERAIFEADHANPNFKKKDMSLAALAMARRMENAFSEGGNKHEVMPNPSTGGIRSVLRRPLDSTEVPEWLARGTENDMTSAPLVAWFERSVPLNHDDRGGLIVGEPTYKLVAQRWEHEDGHMAKGVRSEVAYEGPRHMFSGGKSIAAPNRVLHGKNVGLGGPRWFEHNIGVDELNSVLPE